MSQDDLAEIEGIKPNVWLADGEEKEVGSQSSKSVYKCKRTLDHYYCTCPAWRNQSGMPVNARSCKHLKSLLGEDYEAARIRLRNPDAPPAKGKSASKASKPASKSTATKLRSKRRQVEEGEDEGDGEDEEAKPTRRSSRAKPASTSAKPPSKSAAKRKRADDDEGDVEDDDGGDDEEVKPTRRSSRAKPASTSAKPPSKSAKPPSKPAVKRKRSNDDEGDAEDDGDNKDIKQPATKRSRKPASSASNSSATKSNTKAKADIDVKMEGIEEQDEDDERDANPSEQPAGDGDELASINGVKPKVLLADGEEREISSMTSNSKYKIKRTWDHYYCSCPAWRNQSGAPVNARTCKHIKDLLGEKYEVARLKLKNPHGAVPTSKSKPASKARSAGKQRANADEEADDDDGDGDDGTTGGGSKIKKVPELLLACKWDLETGPDPTGWWMSEKLDGVRAFYDGSRMFSRLGNLFTPPQWFLDALPKNITLDGELFGGRGQFQSTVSIVKTVNSPHWKGISFQVFDVPSKSDLPFEDRLAYLKATFGEGGTHTAKFVTVVEQTETKDRPHVLEKLKEIESLGGEGLMLRKPGSLYEGRRSSTLQKIKTFYDAEAVVTGYEPGKGRHKGVTGSLRCKMASGKNFNVGTGLSDKQRKNPPPVGAIITYRFQELTRDGVPRFPSYIGEAVDKDEPKDADIPEHRKAGAAKSGED